MSGQSSVAETYHRFGGSRMKKVAILIPSFRPARFFSSLLPELQRQIGEFSQVSAVAVQIIALFPESVDLSDFTDEKNLRSITVLRTKEKGFSIPRNLLWNSANGFDVNIFVDDDQVPMRNWLSDYMSCIDENPSHSVFIGQVYYRLDSEEDSSGLSRLLASNRIGRGETIDYVSIGIGNTAIVRELIDNLHSPFSLDFNEGGEDVFFFHLLKQKGVIFFQMAGASVIEYWDLTRMNTTSMISRDRRGIDSYYKMRHLTIQNRTFGRLDSLIVNSRLFAVLVFSPLFLLIIMLNVLNPFRFHRFWVLRFLAKVFFVSVAPWKAKLSRAKGFDHVDFI